LGSVLLRFWQVREIRIYTQTHSKSAKHQNQRSTKPIHEIHENHPDNKGIKIIDRQNPFLRSIILKPPDIFEPRIRRHQNQRSTIPILEIHDIGVKTTTDPSLCGAGI
jgi:hypothetical protein